MPRPWAPPTRHVQALQLTLCGWSLLALGAQLCSADWPSKASLPPLLIRMDAPAHGFQEFFHNPSLLVAFSPFFLQNFFLQNLAGCQRHSKPLWVHTLSHVTLCNTMDYSSPCFSVHDISQARILEWVAIFFSREYWSGLPLSSPGDLPDSGIEPGFPAL